MTNGAIPERGEVEWKVKRQTYVLALPLRQLRVLDKELLCGGVLKLMAPGTRGVFDAQVEDVERILRYGLAGGGNDLDKEAFERLWDSCGMLEMVTACDLLLGATLKGADKTPPKEDATDPPLPEKPAEPPS